MKRYLMFAICSVIFGCTATAFAEGLPDSVLPTALPKSTLPKDCDCQPCTCEPGTCTCAGCANGCRKAGQASEATYEVGIVETQSALPAIPRASQATQATQGFHTEYRQVCDGQQCRLVAVSVPDPVTTGATYAPVSPVSACASCGTNAGAAYQAGAVYGARGEGACSSGARGPIRRIFGIFRRGRCGG